MRVKGGWRAVTKIKEGVYLFKGSVKVSKERLARCEKVEETRESQRMQDEREKTRGERHKKKEPTGGNDESSSHGRK